MNLDLKFSAFALYPLLLLILAVVFTLFIYRTTTPRAASWLRRSLAGLRGFALAAALLLLFEPIMSLARQRAQKPVAAILLDRSASMALQDSLGARGELAQKTLAMPWLNRLRERAEPAFFAFSDSLHALTKDSLSNLHFNGDGSNITAALLSAKEKLAGRQYGAAVLLSDGAYNLGANPGRAAEAYGVPIVSVRLGGNRQTRDAMISEVVTNEIAYAETQLPAEISLSATGFAGRKTKLRVFEAGNEIQTQDVELPGDNTQTVVKLTLTPKTLGLNRYEVKLDALENEQTLANNRRVFYVRVLKSKLNLWIFAGAPSPDYAFLKRALQNDPNYRVLGFAQKPGGAFYSAPDESLPNVRQAEAWKEVDAIMLVDFPRRDSDRSVLEALQRELAQNHRPFFYLHGPAVDLNALWRWRGVLPWAAMPSLTNERAVTLQLEPNGLVHPVTRPLAEANSANATNNLPPLFSNIAPLKVLPGSEILMATTNSSTRATEPLWVAQKNAASKTLAIFSYGLWRWHLMMQTQEQSSPVYESTVRGLVRWLVTKEDAKLVRFTSNKEIYRGGEPIELLAQVYREDYQPLAGAQVRAELTGPQLQQEVILQDVGTGLYRAHVQVLAGGEYQFRGAAEFAGKKLGEDTGRFSVEPFSVEFLQTRFNEPVLRQIAEASGGKYVAPDSLEAALAQLKLAPEIKHESRDYALWGKPELLFALLFVLAVEWFIRKRQGML
jgi:hypothetical protein